ncbi:hypothetical protein GCM10011403_08430 [Pseudohongiella nitratireducens]|uniref:Uncharacterized protein n=1 Tax=Pseudohongiella nitratireducens TaxID=1768907 RepID=A0A917GPH5_9GAMM|nr:hypothetical protein [Pseudohongiella nitratireducens]GGG53583.1 hypothetical protein GCM10011403_08430 [Pseudohongiella nitratireducens]
MYTSRILALPFLLISTALSAQSSEIPRTSDGKPDLQGIWSNATQTSLERPARYGERQALTDQEALDMQDGAQSRAERGNAPSDPDRPPPSDGNTAAAYNSFWLDRGTGVVQVDGEYRTSLIIDPPDGQIPYRENAPEQNKMEQWRDEHGADAFLGPEMATIGERCLLFYDFRTSNSSAGPPMMPMIYNNNYQIVQTDDYVMILAEMMHDARIIRLNSEHQDPAIHKWMGDTIGHWEGDTLVFTTRNLHPQQSHFGSGPGLVVTESLRMVSDSEIVYRFTMDDPVAYESPWTAEMVFHAQPPGEQIYEYACHEGNYALPGILAGKRREESQEQESGPADSTQAD